MTTAAADVLAEARAAEYARATELYTRVVTDDTLGDERETETAILALGALHARHANADALAALLVAIRPFTQRIAKAKTAKIVRTLLDAASTLHDALPLQAQLCRDVVAWCKEERRTFLRQRVEAKLAEVLRQQRDYQTALALLAPLLREIKRLDDKQLLLEIQLLESRIHQELRNHPRSKASLTSARTVANAIYCPPLLQASIDMQAGTLHAEERDYKTAYSYFYEAFEGYSALDAAASKGVRVSAAKAASAGATTSLSTSLSSSMDMDAAEANAAAADAAAASPATAPKPRDATRALKYMLLCKICLGAVDDVHALVNGKLMLKHAGADVEAMRAVATARKNRSLAEFQAALDTYSRQIGDDELTARHVRELYDELLTANLLRLIEPYSRVELAHVAALIELDEKRVERKLSQMILDKQLDGVLDQGARCLVVFDEQRADATYPAALETIEHTSSVVDAIFMRARRLNQ